MTIRKGQEWGSLVVPGRGMRTVSSDAELRELVIASGQAGLPLPVVGLLGGDMMRTLGGSGDRARFSGDEPIPHVPIDIVEVVADGERKSLFVSHLITRRSTLRGGWWRGSITAAMNAQFLGRWDVSPRGHPNDGKLDLVSVDASLGIQQRWLAARRLPLGTHVPHPGISVKQHASVTVELDRPTPVRLDGQQWGRALSLQLMVVPDAVVVCV